MHETESEIGVGWVVYILECSDGTLYTGVTNEMDRRVAQHEEGKGAKFTRGRGPFKVVYEERQPDRGAALRREMEIKSLRRAAKFALIDAGPTRPAARSRALR